MADDQLPESASAPGSPLVDAKPVDNAPVEGNDMHIHKPKPLHKFREVLGEIGIIVIGILIAIALEQVVEEIHWSNQVKNARKALRVEAAASNAVFRYRLAANACVERRLAVLEGITEQAARGKPVPTIGPIVSNIDFALVDSSWQAQRASQVLTHFDEEELSRFGSFYFQLGTTQKLIGEEATSWRTIAVLEGNPARLSNADFANVRIAIKTARDINGLIQHLAAEQLDTSRALNLPTEPIFNERLALACAPIEQHAAR